ncbi:MAG TPA: amidohydrolase family protein [Terriglobia bacterium]
MLISGNKISSITSGAVAPPDGATVIDAHDRVLIPGLTDAHWHMVFAPNTLANMEAADTGLMYANAVAEAQRTLMRGFTTIRDTGGPTFGLKQAIDSGVIPGPRVYPSGALISQTAGHGDFGPDYDRPVALGGGVIAEGDGREERVAEPPAIPAGDNPLTPAQVAKAEPTSHWQRVATWAKEQGTKLAFGTDMLFQPAGTKNQNLLLTRFAQVFSNSETLRIATSPNCELFSMSGLRNPYKEAKLGVIQSGAWADMLLVDEDPTQNIDLLRDFDRNLVVIVKDGVIWKNTLPRG